MFKNQDGWKTYYGHDKQGTIFPGEYMKIPMRRRQRKFSNTIALNRAVRIASE